VLRGYIALALLYNEQAEKRGETLIAPDILSEFWVLQHTVKFLQTYWTETQNKSREKPTDYWPEIRNVLINDLEAVDRDLASTKPPTEASGEAERLGQRLLMEASIKFSVLSMAIQSRLKRRRVACQFALLASIHPKLSIH